MGWLTDRVLRIPAEEASCARRGFHVGDVGIQLRLESIGQTFLRGYHFALCDRGGAVLAQELRSIHSGMRGFAFEGAGMALTLLDHLAPVKRGRYQNFVEREGGPHLYLLQVGAGWALARLPWLRWRADSFLAALDPLLRWLAADGYGFHQGYFYWPRFIRRQEIPRGLSPYARRAFDQGLGRSLWFVEGAEGPRITAAISAFAVTRHADLWSGVGLACAYAGGMDDSGMEALRAAADAHSVHLAQGAAFAAAARQRASNPELHTEQACQVLCGFSAEAAAETTFAAMRDLPPDGAVPAYEIWRQRIRQSVGQKSAARKSVVA